MSTRRKNRKQKGRGVSFSRGNNPPVQRNLTNLRNENLDREDLEGRTIINGRWENVSLVRANLTGIRAVLTLINVNFSEAILENAVLRHLTLGGQLINFTGANLTGANFGDIIIISTLVRIIFQRATLIRTNFRGVNGRLRLQGADFRGANLTGARLEDVNLHNANFTGANLTDTIFTNCYFTGAIFTDAIGNVPTQDMIENMRQEEERELRDEEREEEREEEDEDEALPLPQGRAYEIHNAFRSVDMPAYRRMIDNVVQKEDSF